MKHIVVLRELRLEVQFDKKADSSFVGRPL